MPKRGRIFINEFLVPNLNEENFGDRLAWVNRGLSIFQMQWNHKSASVWTEDDCQVFVEWDKKRGHYRPMEKEYFTKSKQRFRAVLNKSIQQKEITQLPFEDKNIKVFFLGSADKVPIGFKLIEKNAMNDENDFSSNYIKTENTLVNSMYLEGEDKLTEIDGCNALKDHNYQNTEDHKIPECYDVGFDSSKNDLSLYSFCNCEKNVLTSPNNLELLNEEVFLGNCTSEVYGPAKEYNILLENNLFVNGAYHQALPPMATFSSTSDLQKDAFRVSLKRGIEHSDSHASKKSTILVYLKADTA